MEIYPLAEQCGGKNMSQVSSLAGRPRSVAMLRTAMWSAVARHLSDPSVIEVMLNPDRRLWIDRLADGMAGTGETILLKDDERIVRLVAHLVGAEVHVPERLQPLINAPSTDSGRSALGGENCRSGLESPDNIFCRSFSYV